MNPIALKLVRDCEQGLL